MSVLFKALKRAARDHADNRGAEDGDSPDGGPYDPLQGGAAGPRPPRRRLRIALRLLALVLFVLAGTSVGLLYTMDPADLQRLAGRYGVTSAGGQADALKQKTDEPDTPPRENAERAARELAAARTADPVGDPPPRAMDSRPPEQADPPGADNPAPAQAESRATSDRASDAAPEPENSDAGADLPPPDVADAAPSPTAPDGGTPVTGHLLAGLFGFIEAGMADPPRAETAAKTADSGDRETDKPHTLSSAGFPDPDTGQGETEAEVGAILPGGGVAKDAGQQGGTDAGDEGQPAADGAGEGPDDAGLGEPVEKAPPGPGEPTGVERGKAPQTGAVQAPQGRVAVKPGGERRARRLARAHRALQRGDAERALGLYERILKNSPRDARALFGRGVALQRLNMAEAARKAYEKVLSMAPDHSGALANLQTLIGEEHPAAAIRRLSELAAKHPSVSTIPAQKARLLADTGNPQQAIDAMERAVRLAPRNLDHRLNLAVLHDRAGNATSALKHYTAVLDLARSTGQSPTMPVDQIKARVEYLKGRLAE